MPQFFREKWHERREQSQCGLEDAHQGIERQLRGLILRNGEVQPQLHELHIPVAELSPEKLIDSVRGFVEAETIECCRDLLRNCMKPRGNPSRLERRNAEILRERQRDFVTGLSCTIDLHLHEPRGVPYLVGERAIALCPLLAEGDVCSR